MWNAMNPAFGSTIQQSHQVTNLLNVCDNVGNILRTIYPDAGSITADATSSRTVKRDCSFEVPDYDGTLTPVGATDLLSGTSGNELRAYQGLVFPDSTTELVPMGVFPIRSCTVASNNTGPVITLGAQDRSTIVSRNRWTSPYAIAGGGALEDVITALLVSRYPGVQTNFPATGYTVPATVLGLDTQNDPWADAQTIVKASGLDLTFDVTGTAVFTSPVDPASADPVVTYQENALSVVTDASKVWDTTTAYNGVIGIAEGSNITPPIRVELWDDDPTSPTYRGGPYGQVPEFITSQYWTTVGQVTQACYAELARVRGIAQTLGWNMVPDFRLDPGVDALGYSSSKLQVPLVVVALDAITFPWLPTDTSGVTIRTNQVLT